MSVPPESPEEVTQRIPPLRQSDTAPLWRSSEPGRSDPRVAAPAPPAPPSPSRRGLVLKGLGLLGVAMVSGLVWLVVMPKSDPSGTPAATTSASAGEFSFAKSPSVPEPLKDSNCAPHAYGQTKTFLTDSPCQQLTRGLYTTKTPDGVTVYTSVSVVRMKTAEDAAKLKELTTRDGTGNVNDLVKDGAVKVEGLTTLANGGFAALLKDQDVIIVESDTVKHGPNEAEHNRLMRRISIDAFRLAAGLN